MVALCPPPGIPPPPGCEHIDSPYQPGFPGTAEKDRTAARLLEQVAKELDKVWKRNIFAKEHYLNASVLDSVYHDLWSGTSVCAPLPEGLPLPRVCPADCQEEEETTLSGAKAWIQGDRRGPNTAMQPGAAHPAEPPFAWWPGCVPNAAPAVLPDDGKAGPIRVPAWDKPWVDAMGVSTLAARAVGGPATQHQYQECRWHASANSVGTLSVDGHVFTKRDVGSKKVIMSNRGVPVELSTIRMVYDTTLRRGGTHRYNYQILEGELGAADGAGFVFDKQVRRCNIQKMRSVFLNQRGCICLRDNGQVCKLQAQLPPLAVGMRLTLHIDLDTLAVQFAVSSMDGALYGIADVSLMGLLNRSPTGEVPSSGFFCAVVTKDITVALS